MPASEPETQHPWSSWRRGDCDDEWRASMTGSSSSSSSCVLLWCPLDRGGWCPAAMNRRSMHQRLQTGPANIKPMQPSLQAFVMA